MTELNKDELRRRIGGRIFAVTFKKTDGSMRRMLCRTGVGKYHQGGKCTSAHIPHLLNVYDISKRGYRTVNLKTVTELRCGTFIYKGGK